MKENNIFYDSLKAWVIVLILMALAGYFMAGCNFPLLDIYHDEDIVSQNDTVIIVNDTIPTDTMPEPIVLDTCDEYHDIANTKFSTWAVNLDGMNPNGYVFAYKPGAVPIYNIDIDSFLNQYGQSKTYYSGINVAGIVTGLDNPPYVLNHSLYMIDQFGGWHLVYLQPYLFNFQGALTFVQFFSELTGHSNFKHLGFFNTGNFSCDQVNQILDYLIDNCINGHGDKIDLRFATCQDQDRIGLLELAGFTVIQ